MRYEERRKRSELRDIRRRRWLLAIAFFVGGALVAMAVGLVVVLASL